MRLLNFYINDNKTRTWTLYPFGDLQFGASGFDEDLWDKLVNEIKHDPFALTIGMGDYSDWWRPTAQNKIDSAAIGDGDLKASLDELHQTHMKKVFDKLAPIIRKGRCLGLLAGHHDYSYATGMNATQWLCDRLRVPYLDRMAMVKVIYADPRRNGHGHVFSIKIHAQHGDGGAGFIGPDMANLERKTAPYWNADVFLRGHSTKHWASAIAIGDMTEPRSRKEDPRLVMKERWICNTGGFMNGYQDGATSYVEKRNMPPAHLGYIKVHLRLTDNHHMRKVCNRRGEEIRISVTQ